MRNRIKTLRKEAGLTQRSLSEKSGVPLRTIQKWENGEREPSDLLSLKKIANTLNTTIDSLFTWEELKMRIKKYEVMENAAEVKEYEEGCTVILPDICPKTLASFDNLEEAQEELKKHSCGGYRFGSGAIARYAITEVYIQENIYDEDGEWMDGGDIWEFAKLGTIRE